MLKKFFLEIKLRKEICSIGGLLFQRGFVAANDGNISARLSEDEYLFTPTNVSKGAIKPRMLVKVDGRGNVIKGKMRVSSESMMHLRVYKENSDVNAVVHAHPQVATSYAIAGVPLDKALITESVVLMGIVPVAPYGLPGSEALADTIAPYCTEYNSVLLKNHGVLSWGKDLKEAYFRMEITENLAVIMKYNEELFQGRGALDKKQVEDLIKIREDLGIKGGGIPEGEHDG
jgi:L-fuculose-phosphate aldolase